MELLLSELPAAAPGNALCPTSFASSTGDKRRWNALVPGKRQPRSSFSNRELSFSASLPEPCPTLTDLRGTAYIG
jgi:hypothetical protein